MRRTSYLGPLTVLLSSVGLALLLVLVIGVASAAVAKQEPAAVGQQDGNPLRYVSKQGHYVKNKVGWWTADPGCASGEVVVGGGFQVFQPGAGNDFEGTIEKSEPLGDGRGNGWSTGVGLHSPYLNPESYYGYAVCAPASLLPGHNIQYENAKIAPEGTRTLRASCKRADEVALGGGFSMYKSSSEGSGAEPEGKPHLIRTQPEVASNRQWVATVYNGYPNSLFKPKVSVGITVLVICVPEETLRNFHFEHAANTERKGVPTNTPRCPSGTYLLGGGAGVPEKEKKTIWRSIRPGGGDPPTIWSAGAYSDGSLTLHAYAMCAGFTHQEEEPGSPPEQTLGENPIGGGEQGGRIE